MKYDVVLLAGGKGTRLNLGYNKVLYKMDNGLTILENAMAPFLKDEDLNKIIVVASIADQAQIKLLPKMEFVENGKERFNSVMNGLSKVESPYVMIHDGARPNITSEDIAHLKETLMCEEACMLAKASKDTVKEVVDGYIVKTLDRRTIYLAQTPQCFKSALIKEAYQAALNSEYGFTDDASVLEWYDSSKRIKIVDSVNSNNKITFIDDLG